MKKHALWCVCVFLIALTATSSAQEVSDSRVTAKLAVFVQTILNNANTTIPMTSGQVRRFFEERPEINAMISACVQKNLTNSNSNILALTTDSDYSFALSTHDVIQHDTSVFAKGASHVNTTMTENSCSVHDILKRVVEHFLETNLSMDNQIQSGPVVIEPSGLMPAHTGMGTRPGIGSGFLFGFSQATLQSIWTASLVTLFMWGLLLMMVNFGGEEPAFDRMVEMMKGSSATVPIQKQIERWRTIKTIFPSFQRWYDVYSHPAARFAEESGTYRVCLDWLPYMYSGYTSKSVVETMGTWDDKFGIFEPNLDSTAISTMNGLATAAEIKWREQAKVQKKVLTQDTGSINTFDEKPRGSETSVGSQEDSRKEDRKAFLQFLTLEHARKKNENHPSQNADTKILKREVVTNDGEVLDLMMQEELQKRKLNKPNLKDVNDPSQIDRSQCPPNFSSLDENDVDWLKEIILSFQNQFEALHLSALGHLTRFDDSTSKEILVRNAKILCFDSSVLSNTELATQVGKTVPEIKEMVKKYFENPEACNEDEANWCRWWNFKYTLKSMHDSIREYFEGDGPRYRLRYLFPTQSEIDDDVSVLQHQKRKRSLMLPKEDLKMCWRIMETSLFTIGRQTQEATLTFVSAVIRSLLTSVVAVLAFVMAVMTMIRLYSRTAAGSAYLRNCGPLELSHEHDLRVLCTDGWMAGSTCSITCANGKKILLPSGSAAPTITTCIGGYTWQPSIDGLAVMCSDVRLDTFSLPAMGY